MPSERKLSQFEVAVDWVELTVPLAQYQLYKTGGHSRVIRNSQTLFVPFQKVCYDICDLINLTCYKHIARSG